MGKRNKKSELVKKPDNDTCKNELMVGTKIGLTDFRILNTRT